MEFLMFNIHFFCSIQACADAYLTPCIKRYVSGFMSGFKAGIEVIKNYLLTVTNRIDSKTMVQYFS